MRRHSDGGARADRAREPSQRQLRVGESIRHALVAILGREDLHEPELSERSITVSEVRASPDLRQAVCFVTPLGGGDAGPVCDALNRRAGWLASRVARQVRLRYATRLEFRPDNRFDDAQRIDGLLRSPSVARDLDDREEC